MIGDWIVIALAFAGLWLVWMAANWVLDLIGFGLEYRCSCRKGGWDPACPVHGREAA